MMPARKVSRRSQTSEEQTIISSIINDDNDSKQSSPAIDTLNTITTNSRSVETAKEVLARLEKYRKYNKIDEIDGKTTTTIHKEADKEKIVKVFARKSKHTGITKRKKYNDKFKRPLFQANNSTSIREISNISKISSNLQSLIQSIKTSRTENNQILKFISDQFIPTLNKLADAKHENLSLDQESTVVPWNLDVIHDILNASENISVSNRLTQHIASNLNDIDISHISMILDNDKGLHTKDVQDLLNITYTKEQREKDAILLNFALSKKLNQDKLNNNLNTNKGGNTEKYINNKLNFDAWAMKRNKNISKKNIPFL
ncbi:uncharacterized protein SCDLUD_002005 [Saccharomycodes ludwigii]|uniref:uncharacterized protein n=1 Tax=Saccharomycodes ludwigii TaxID=36035 RepID=UPI001E840759|nr:hypothetical protein SCDLUD_002005 [Saccharomycodes ludwigii]KAH3902190.1 hypothetical protein SCDLUD_002005 [Saccharomycodes ludwigii]